MSDPTPDEFQRVAAYWTKVERLVCDHPEITFGVESTPSCSKCGRPVRMLSDIQIEELRQQGGGDA
jgi:hypothetical protein